MRKVKRLFTKINWEDVKLFFSFLFWGYFFLFVFVVYPFLKIEYQEKRIKNEIKQLRTEALATPTPNLSIIITPPPKIFQNEIRTKAKICAIQKLYKRYNSPLEKYAEYMVVSAHNHDIGWYYLPVISIIESSGRNFFRPYNAWGWMGKETFTSWEDGIDTVAYSLQKGYISVGCDTFECISKYWCPPTHDKWAKSAHIVMGNLLKYYEQCYEEQK